MEYKYINAISEYEDTYLIQTKTSIMLGIVEAKEFRHYALREFFKLDDNDFQNTSI
jgi:hypothetical protein